MSRSGVLGRGRATALAVVALIALAVVLPLVLPAFQVFQLSIVIVYAVALLGLTLLVGRSGQVSLGHNFFFAIGAYATATAAVHLGVSPYLCIPISGIVGYVLGLVVGIPSLRLKGIYLALVTLALGAVTVPLIKRFGDVTGGVTGMSVPQPIAPDWSGLAQDQWLYYLCLAVLLIVLFAARQVTTGRIGRAMIAARDQAVSAEAMGIGSGRLAVLSFALAGLYAGIGGSLYALVVGYVAPESFPLVLALMMIGSLIIGGTTSLAGALLGALFLEFVPLVTREVNQSLSGAVFAIVIIAILVLLPDGLASLPRRLRRLLTPRSRPAN